MKVNFPILILFFSLTFANCTDEVPEVNNTAEFDTLLQDEMDVQNIPTLSVLIFKNNIVLYENYLGKTDIE